MYRFVLNLGLSFVTAFVSQGCFPSKEATSISKETIHGSKTENEPAWKTNWTSIDFPVKVILTDASIVLFPGGIRAYVDSLVGAGQRYTISGIQAGEQRPIAISMDSVAAITKYHLKSSAGQVIGSVLHGIIGGAMTPLSIYCISCPKCCFGSCPTVYTHDGQAYNLESELFSHCISKQLEEKDVDLLAQPVPDNGEYTIRITNEAMETHYINEFSMHAMHHPLGTRLFLSEEGHPLALNAVSRPRSALDRMGNNILGLIETQDSLAYRSGDKGVASMLEGQRVDWLDVTANVPRGAKRIRMLMRWRNTLLSTILLYDVVLASQGIDALNWVDRMDTDPVYASQFRQVYEELSGIAVCVRNGEKWIRVKSIKDVGPLAWKTVVVEIPVDHAGELAVRLQFVPDNAMIDMIGFDTTSRADIQIDIEKIEAVEVRDNSGASRSDVLRLMENDDEQYLVMYP